MNLLQAFSKTSIQWTVVQRYQMKAKDLVFKLVQDLAHRFHWHSSKKGLLHIYGVR